MRRIPVDNPRYPHHIRIIRKVIADWLPSDDEKADDQDTVVYEGCGRSYTETTTTGDAKVDSNKRKASIPVRFDKWEDLFPMSGDILYVTKGNIGEEWEVKDFEPDNDRSVIYGEMSRNFNIE